MARTLVSRALAVGAAAALVSGCSPSEAGTAASVDGHSVSIAQVQSAANDLAVLNNGQPAPQQTMALLLVGEPTITKIADKVGRGVSRDDAAALLRSRKVEPTDAGIDAMRAFMELRRLDPNLGNALRETYTVLTTQHLSVNPRYGTLEPGRLDPTSLEVPPAPANWIDVEGLARQPRQPAQPQDQAPPEGQPGQDQPAPVPAPSAAAGGGAASPVPSSS